MANQVKRFEVVIEKLQDKSFLVREVTTLANGDKCEFSTSFKTLDEVKNHIDFFKRLYL